MWPARAGEAPGERRFFAAGRLFHPRPARPLRRAGAAVGRAPPSSECLSAAAQHRARARPMAHDDPDRERARVSCAHSPEPFIEIHPADAKASEARRRRRLPKSRREYGGAILKVCHRRPASGAARSLRRSIGATPRRPRARIGDTGRRRPTTRYSGQPELKATPARVQPVRVRVSRALSLTRHRRRAPGRERCFARVAVAGGDGLLFATERAARLAGTVLTRHADARRRTSSPNTSTRRAASIRVAALPLWPPRRLHFRRAGPNAVRSGTRRARCSRPGVVSRARPARSPVRAQQRRASSETGPGDLRLLRRRTSRRSATPSPRAEAASVADIGRTLRAGTNCGRRCRAAGLGR